MANSPLRRPAIYWGGSLGEGYLRFPWHRAIYQAILRDFLAPGAVAKLRAFEADEEVVFFLMVRDAEEVPIP